MADEHLRREGEGGTGVDHVQPDTSKLAPMSGSIADVVSVVATAIVAHLLLRTISAATPVPDGLL